MAVAEAVRPLPGVVFEAEPPPSPRVFPRMDVAGFVGFAASGPLDTPVVVEDAEQFERLFGRDAPLAWDEEHREDVFSQLGPAVRSFFRNGGRRAWIVRVADPDVAKRNRFAVPGLVARTGAALAPTVFEARAVGSWSDELTVATALTSTPAVVQEGALAAEIYAFRLELAGRSTIVPADLLRVRTPMHDLLVVAKNVERSRVGVQAPGRSVVTVSADPATALWLERLAPDEVVGAAGTAHYTAADGRARTASARVPPARSPAEELPDDERIELEVEGSALDEPQPGTLVRVAGLVPRADLWLAVEDVRTAAPGSAGADFRISGYASWTLFGQPSPLSAIEPGAAAERLTFELWTRNATSWRVRLEELGFAAGHPRFAGDLPTDELLYADREVTVDPQPAVWTPAADPRFPLAAPASTDGQPPTFYPLGMRAVPTHYVTARKPGGSQRERDGLAAFRAGLFLDERLRHVGVDALEAEANHVRWQAPRPRPLTGAHALLGVDEVTIVSVPDCAQRPWRLRPDDPIPSPPPHEESPPASPPEAPPLFFECQTRELPPATSLRATDADAAGSFLLEWDPVDEGGIRYRLEESSDRRSWRGARAIYDGPAFARPVVGRSPGTYFYRVRSLAGESAGPWSNAVAVRVGSGARYVVEPAEDYEPTALRAVHRAVLRMCASRGDLLAVLSTPQHYREEEAIAHARALRAARDQMTPGIPPPRPEERVLPLSGAETRALGYGALYHPWLVTGPPDRPGELRRTAPDGGVAGVLALRAATRGAWVAPANEPIRDVVALAQASRRESYAALQAAQVNEIRSEPGAVVCLSEDTLILDEEIRQVNVRRLLSLLRRLALLHGPDYIFEPNDPAFRRSVERGFDELLGFLYELGAFAGATADEGYRVVVGDPPNTPASIDQGRLIVELRVAPSRPLAFLVVRLIHAGERGFSLEAP